MKTVTEWSKAMVKRMPDSMKVKTWMKNIWMRQGSKSISGTLNQESGGQGGSMESPAANRERKKYMGS